jgi:hypothetical protein
MAQRAVAEQRPPRPAWRSGQAWPPRHSLYLLYSVHELTLLALSVHKYKHSHVSLAAQVLTVLALLVQKKKMLTCQAGRAGTDGNRGPEGTTGPPGLKGRVVVLKELVKQRDSTAMLRGSTSV